MLIVAHHPRLNANLTRAICHTLAAAAARRPSWVAHTRALIPSATVEALFHFWRDRIRYEREDGERLQTLGVTLARGAGDCDDKSIGIGTMAGCLGWHWRFWQLGYDGDNRLVSCPPGQRIPRGVRPFHIWPEVHDGRRWWHLETCETAAQLGEHPADLIRRLRSVRF